MGKITVDSALGVNQCPVCKSIISSKVLINDLNSSIEDAEKGIYKFKSRVQMHYTCGAVVSILIDENEAFSIKQCNNAKTVRGAFYDEH